MNFLNSTLAKLGMLFNKKKFLNFSEELLKYVPSGVLNSYELKHKMSLYLLAQLFYGITLIHQVQADFLCGMLKTL